MIAVMGALVIGVAAGCIRDARPFYATTPVGQQRPPRVESRSWALCTLVGPQGQDPGVYGTDLGFTVKQPNTDRLAILFGDTWARPRQACKYPVRHSDDLQAWLPAQRPSMLEPGAPTRLAGAACRGFHYDLQDKSDPTSWTRIRLFASAAKAKQEPLDTGMLRTPLTAFSDGKHVFGIFMRNDPAFCKRSTECPAGMECSSDPSYRGKRLGVCAEPPLNFSDDPMVVFCREGDDCGPLKCKESARGVCMAKEPCQIPSARGAVVPRWFEHDARLAVAHRMYVAEAIWPERPADYAIVAEFTTQRFFNVTAKAVAFFDPEHPEKSDYRPGFHTLFVWGRPGFASRDGAQSLPFLAYVPLSELSADDAKARFRMRFFAGYARDGKPEWSDLERDAKPIYGTEAGVEAEGRQLRFREPEFDYVNQMSVSYLAPLERWLMFYGGDEPTLGVMDGNSGKAKQPFYNSPAPGAIHLRVARHPWGRLDERAEDGAWSSADPVLTRQQAARYLVCGDDGEKDMPGCLKKPDGDGPFSLLGMLAKAVVQSPGQIFKLAGSCIGGAFAMRVQNAGNDMGRLYGANIIDEWTEDVTPNLHDLKAGERAVEVYWNASTWNPYQVVLLKTQIRAKASTSAPQ